MKTMIVTGGTGAIGSMTAYWGVRCGWQVVLCYYQNEKAAKELQEDLQNLGGTVWLYQADLRQSEARAGLVEFALKECGKVDLLVNNFGTAHYQAFDQEDEQSIAEVLQTNLYAHMALTNRLLPAMLQQKSGSIINISSVWGQTGAACEVAYSAAKAGLIGFTKALAKELAPSGINVNCVAPGIVESKMLGDLDRNALKEMVPKGELCSGLDIAKTILFLAEQEQFTGTISKENEE